MPNALNLFAALIGSTGARWVTMGVTRNVASRALEFALLIDVYCPWALAYEHGMFASCGFTGYYVLARQYIAGPQAI